jgi:hypothetical protein
VKRIYINPLRLLNVCLSQGLVTKEEALEAIREGIGQRGKEKQLQASARLGGFRTEHNVLGNAFLASKYENGERTNEFMTTGKGKRIGLNLRVNNKDQRASQTPNQVVGGQAGTPAITAQVRDVIAKAVKDALGGQVAVSVDDEFDELLEL